MLANFITIVVKLESECNTLLRYFTAQDCVYGSIPDVYNSILSTVGNSLQIFEIMLTNTFYS